MVYYNEIDEYAAEWLSRLMDAGVIAKGAIDTRSIEDVTPDDLTGFTQCHFFAGIGGWSAALRLAGWPDDRPVWTGSCPCQPFSAAGKGDGFDDERHLWPSWHWLIRQCRPRVLFGEQVDAAVGHHWLDLVSTDLEGEGYEVGPVVLPAAGIGAPHGRHRLWFVADTDRGADDAFLWAGQDDSVAVDRSGTVGRSARRLASEVGRKSIVGDAENVRHERRGSARRGRVGLANASDARGMADSNGGEPSDRGLQCGGGHLQQPKDATAGFWTACDWIPCRDSKWRPVEPGTFPLAYGIRNRVGRLRAYGNAIVPQVAAQVIEAYCEVRGL